MTDNWRTVNVVSGNVAMWRFESEHHIVPYCSLCGREPAYTSKYCDSCYRLMVLLKPLGPWVEKALCSADDPDFFPEKGTDTKGATDRAKAICAKCPVQEVCLETALQNNEKHGIWGGKGRPQREKIRRERGMF